MAVITAAAATVAWVHYICSGDVSSVKRLSVPLHETVNEKAHELLRGGSRRVYVRFSRRGTYTHTQAIQPQIVAGRVGQERLLAAHQHLRTCHIHRELAQRAMSFRKEEQRCAERRRLEWARAPSLAHRFRNRIVKKGRGRCKQCGTQRRRREEERQQDGEGAHCDCARGESSSHSSFPTLRHRTWRAGGAVANWAEAERR